MAEFITDKDVAVLEEIARRCRKRNLLGSCHQKTAQADADLFVETLNRVCLRLHELGCRKKG